ncbi:MAG: glycosyltransferase [Burkholderiales bacterium]|jgi:GT2 family glycosyltransferase|nr:glycosyltransferase [Burkholderiales bacterium]
MIVSSLQVSIVTFHPNEDALIRCLYALSEAIEFARVDGVLRTVNVALIDNSESQAVVERLVELGDLFFREPTQVSYLHGHNNIGFGAAQNLTLHGSGADYHLIMSLNTELAQSALAEGVRWMNEHDDIGAAAPALFAPDGSRIYPCRRFPSVFDLFLTGFAPAWLRSFFERRIKYHEMRAETDSHEPFFDIPCFSRACVLARRRVTDQSSGFDPAFFIYFGMHDWILRLGLIARTAYIPAMRAVSYDEIILGSPRVKRKWQFCKSAFSFYRKHGWKWF